MIEREILEAIDETQSLHVKLALALIGRVGIIELQEQRLFERLASGHESEDEETLNRRIREYRRDVMQLNALKELCIICQQDTEQ